MFWLRNKKINIWYALLTRGLISVMFCIDNHGILYITERPWLMDDFDIWKCKRNVPTTPYKCAVIFCDNSGADIILGVFPFARDLLKSGTKVSLRFKN